MSDTTDTGPSFLASKSLKPRSHVHAESGEAFLFSAQKVSNNIATCLGLDSAADATEEAIKSAEVIINAPISACEESSGALAAAEFNTAIKTLREKSPEKWFNVRCRIKDAKPDGVLLSDIDEATKPPGGEDRQIDSAAAELIELALKKAEVHKQLI